MPPPVLIAEPSMLRSLGSGITAETLQLARGCWPGALTIVVTAQPELTLDLGDRDETVAVRVPDHAFTRELLRRTGPLAVSSANVSGREAALSVDEAIDQLGTAWRCTSTRALRLAPSPPPSWTSRGRPPHPSRGPVDPRGTQRRRSRAVRRRCVSTC